MDARGGSIELPRRPGRVVSLVPSVTETLFDLGAGDSVVGITSFCLFPSPEVDAIPRVGGTKTPDIDAIRALRPDLVHLNLEENLRRHGEAIEQFAPVFVSEPKSVEDVVELIGVLGRIHEAEDRAATLCDRIEETRRLLRNVPPFRFACPIWKDPWMWCGGDTYVSSFVAAAGGVNVLGGSLRYPSVSVDDVLALDPEVLFLPDEPYVFTPEDAAMLRTRTAARVIGPFSGHLFTWHGSRTLLGLQFLRGVVTTL